MKKGTFITFEGGEGVGKSTQIARQLECLAKKGYDVLTTREPGGTKGGEIIRDILLSDSAKTLDVKIQAMLFAAARADHVDKIIRPALEQGKIILCDRFIDSTRVYQGYVGGVDMKFLQKLEEVTVGDIFPNLTIIFDLSPIKAQQRIKQRTADNRFDKENIEKHQTRREAFLEIAKLEPKRCIVVDASQSIENVNKNIDDILDNYLKGEQHG